ncbi:syntaxin-4 [Latimeria chalumnae]|uniref:syntaxin-4 n=1 Tax=Latimeria chalumnae TaxID=7897 RepID=UPI0006D93028|nr:PREDICTED: syntaxin-4 [Latimeria chalumnae]|eukprot:XP_014353907.1 PREDICTED: syntaxin-4 [Latimeria chalumnae]
MRDRTKELRDGRDTSEDEDGEEGTALVIKPGSAKYKDTDKLEPMDEFFQEVRQVRQGIDAIRNKVTELEKAQTSVLSVPDPESGTKELQRLRDEIKDLAQHVRKKLKDIELKKGEEEEDNRYSVDSRMKTTQHGILSREFVDVMSQCNVIQAKYRDRNMDRIRRQLRIKQDSVTDEELEKMLDSGETSVFTSNILKDTQTTKQALNEIETRHEEILKLERSIRELHDIFMFLAIEVEAQGDAINRIESNILNSANYVEKATSHTRMAVESQKKARKKKFMIAICVTVLLMIIVIIIAATLGTG